MKKHIVAPIVLLASIALLTSCSDKTPVTTVPTSTPADSVAVDIVTPPESKTLTRTETVGYTSPAGLEQIEFSVTVTDGVIVAATAKPLATVEGSVFNQGNFAKNVSEKVVGKKAKDLDVDAVGGASLTTGAFETFVHSF